MNAIIRPITRMIKSAGLLYSMLAAVILIIIGAGIAMKANQWWGWIVLAAGCGVAFMAARVHGLV